MTLSEWETLLERHTEHAAAVTLPTTQRTSALISKDFGFVLSSCFPVSDHTMAGAASPLFLGKARMGTCELRFCGMSPEYCSRWREETQNLFMSHHPPKMAPSHTVDCMPSRTLTKFLKFFREKLLWLTGSEAVIKWCCVCSVSEFTDRSCWEHAMEQRESRRNRIRRERDHKLEFPISFRAIVTSLEWLHDLPWGPITSVFYDLLLAPADSHAFSPRTFSRLYYI